MSELVIVKKEELESILRNLVQEIFKSPGSIVSTEGEEKLNQKQAAEFLGISEQTIIRHRKNNKLPYERLPGSSKIHYYKSQLKAIVQNNPKLLQASRK